MAIHVTFAITDSGWADCSIGNEATGVTCPVSYLTAGLSDLILSALCAMSSFPQTVFSFDGEPMESRWVIDSQGLNRLRVSVYCFDDIYQGAPLNQGRLVFQDSCGVREYAEAVHATANDVLEKHGIEGYFQKWGHPFPVHLHLALGELIAGRAMSF